MGKILPSFQKSLVDELLDNINSNNSHYYAFAANPIAYTGNSVPDVANNDYDTLFTNNWQLLFGKKIKGSDVFPVIENNIWQTNTIYSKYDNTSNTLHVNNNFYVVSEPTITGGQYHVYKCIDNANGGYSNTDPGSIATPTQPTTFETGDGYKWRYVYSVSTKNYERFGSSNYIPVYANSTLSAASINYAGVENIVITNTGVGYSAYHSGTILSNPNSSIIQIASNASENNDFYVNNSIYIYNTFDSTSQITDIISYVANSSGKFVFVSPLVNTDIITPSISNYIISPKVVFETDGDSSPIAYTTINATSNSINSVVIIDNGTNISWANVSIVSNSSFGSGAKAYAIVPPPGGHGYDPETELNVKGLSVNFSFANTENNSIVTSNVVYNKIGLLKNPNALTANISVGSIQKGNTYTSDTFEQILKANVSIQFTVGETVTGNTSNSKGTVVFSNSSMIYLTGDKTFIDGEYLANSSCTAVSTISINQVGDLYHKDLKPLYVENINNVNRTDEQTESFRLTITL